MYMPYKFTGKELDEETGLYYYRARYMDPMYSVWISPDPALGDYLPTAGADNSGLPGMGGVFNTTNCHLYHYAGNNPVRYVDPDGDSFVDFVDKYFFDGFDKILSNRYVRIVEGALQITGGLAELDVFLYTAGASLYLFFDGLINIVDGALTIEKAIFNNSDYRGSVPEVVSGVLESLGISHDTSVFIGDVIGLIKSLADFKLTSKGTIINALNKDPYDFIGIIDSFITEKNVANIVNTCWQTVKHFLDSFSEGYDD